MTHSNHSTAQQFLTALLARADPKHYLEIRAIGGDLERPKQYFFPVETVLRLSLPASVLALDGTANPYYSATPRIRPGGKAEDCGPAVGAWADFDHGAPAAVPLAPSLVIESSPGKFQGVWLLDSPCEDLALIEAINRTIAQDYGGDPAAVDRARVLRLPGFHNLKYEAHPRARLLVCKPELHYLIGQLQAAFPPVTQAATRTHAPYTGEAPGWLGLVFDAILRYLEARARRPHPMGDGGFKARCPLPGHNDDDPSFTIHPVKGWHCFGRCHEGGRLTLLAHKLGINLQGNDHE